MLDWYSQPRYHPFTMIHDDDRADRPVILMVHGFTGSPDELRPTATIAHGVGFDVEVMHLPGMGPDVARLSETGRKEWEEAVQARWADVTSRYRTRALLGYSLGAALAILASVSRPADALVLMAPLVRLADPRAFLLPVARYVMRELAPYREMDFSTPRARRFFNATMPGLNIDDPEIQRAIREEYVLPIRQVNDCRLLAREAGRRVRFVREPVTVYQGRPDGVVGHRGARWLVDHLGGPVTYHEISGNHLIPFDSLPSWGVMKPLLQQTFCDLHTKLTT